ncbi:MAG: ribonuclease H family protein [Porphyromonas sp.]|nr:ribonuclease H family protein [Porphyromonas sp.]
MSKKSNKLYVVWSGRTPGIYDSWNACRKEVIGVEGAKYKSFEDISLQEAEAIYKAGAGAYFSQRKPSVEKKKSQSEQERVREQEVDWSSIAVDAACSGSPGRMEYRGVWTSSGESVFASKVYSCGTNNVGEFLAIVHALAWMEQHGHRFTIYSDSRTAMTWIRRKECGSKLVQNSKTELLWSHVRRAEEWLRSHDLSKYKILKWETERWGEIPADYGRK